ncbi:MAG TPA: hypothetical protein DDX39_11480 [Bacteroidales bacterium]|nr:MAG: hypothetical protein A2W98_14075 [Bacteroidetes bacterium GWF2_33_38]OFY89320.1 MAG: hypothetical protein A2236_07035 [Bacteroidetes bacterium RIFOXYA2_FULL_33_7]HBF89251.1 hypothetical protein [Bacteroidales bacterium]
MNNLEWSSTYETGIGKIDNQHKNFLEIITTIQKVEKENSDVKKVMRTINELVKYAQYHFLSEENFMEEINYPEFQLHKQLHYKLIELLNIEKNNLELNQISLSHFLDFAVNWFKNHTVNEDKKIAEFFRAQI